MIKDDEITLNGVKISNILDVNVRTETPSDPRGIHREPTTPATITIIRDASNKAIVDAFGFATNEDGRKSIITSGTIDCVSNDRKDSYSFEIKRAIISHWSLNNPPQPNAPTIETIELKVGSFEYKAGGKASKYEDKTFI
jgi:hypothetical protein